MTWESVAVAASLAIVISITGLTYFTWASRELDRRYGKPTDPAE